MNIGTVLNKKMDNVYPSASRSPVEWRGLQAAAFGINFSAIVEQVLADGDSVVNCSPMQCRDSICIHVGR